MSDAAAEISRGHKPYEPIKKGDGDAYVKHLEDLDKLHQNAPDEGPEGYKPITSADMPPIKPPKVGVLDKFKAFLFGKKGI